MKAVLRLLLPYSVPVALATGLGAVVVASNMGLLAAAAYLIAAASVFHLMALLIIPMYAVRILSATRGGARYAERMVSHRVTFRLLARLRVAVFDRLRGLGPAGLRGMHSGDALGRVMADVDSLQSAYLLFLSPVAVAAAVTTLLAVVLLAFGSTLAWIAAGYLAAGILFLPLAVALLTRTPGRTLVSARAELYTQLVDTIQGSTDILSHGAGSRYLTRTVAQATRLARMETRMATVTAGREGTVDLLTNLAMLTTLALAIPLVTRHAISGLYVAVPALLTLAAFESIRPLGQTAEVLSSVQAASRRVLSIGERTEPVAGPAAPVPLLPPFSLAFEEATLDYGAPGRHALHEVSFDVPAGQRVAVVGPSGSGKTSLIHLLTRSREPSCGRVTIAGRDIRDYAQPDLRAVLGVVAQDSYIFNDTVRNNLLLGRPDAPTPELEHALSSVGLLETVQSWPQGPDTWVGEHGRRLSGGERQRLAVARVLLQDAPIILLDEVTANLDPLSEAELLEMLERVIAGRTVLMATHRLIGLEHINEIVVLDHGRLVERGTHARLAATGGLYRRMLDAQENMLGM